MTAEFKIRRQVWWFEGRTKGAGNTSSQPIRWHLGLQQDAVSLNSGGWKHKI